MVSRDRRSVGVFCHPGFYALLSGNPWRRCEQGYEGECALSHVHSIALPDRGREMMATGTIIFYGRLAYLDVLKRASASRNSLEQSSFPLLSDTQLAYLRSA